MKRRVQETTEPKVRVDPRDQFADLTRERLVDLILAVRCEADLESYVAFAHQGASPEGIDRRIRFLLPHKLEDALALARSFQGGKLTKSQVDETMNHLVRSGNIIEAREFAKLREDTTELTEDEIEKTITACIREARVRDNRFDWFMNLEVAVALRQSKTLSPTEAELLCDLLLEGTPGEHASYGSNKTRPHTALCVAKKWTVSPEMINRIVVAAAKNADLHTALAADQMRVEKGLRNAELIEILGAIYDRY